jgi:hypothetical protein
MQMLHEATLESLRQVPWKLHQDRRLSQVKYPRFIFISNSVSLLWFFFFWCSSRNSYNKTNCKMCTSWRDARSVSEGSLRSKCHILSCYSSGVQSFSNFFPGKAPQHLVWAGWRTTRVKPTVIGVHYLLNDCVIFILYMKFTNVAAGRVLHVAVVQG